MPERYPVDERAVTGKAVARLRRDGTIPANIYGRGIESKAVQLPFTQVRTMLRTHGRNMLIELDVAGEGEARPVVIRDIAREPVSGAVQHLDFYQVDLTRAIQADVPIVLTGVAPAVAAEGGILVHGNETVSIEALPTNLPESIEVSVEGLDELDAQLTVADLVAPEGVTILTDSDIVLARVVRPRLAAEDEEVVPEGEEGVEGAAAPAAEPGAADESSESDE
jgi:large subunit ribosomal protein L25